jgi:hypothetical protein
MLIDAIKAKLAILDNINWLMFDYDINRELLFEVNLLVES